MKHGKKPTASQRSFILENRLNAAKWFVVKDTSTDMVLVHRRFDGKTRIIPKGVSADG